ncbi:MAG: hypothetical protein II683_03715 [Muribaculaceae bacterium]|nr:hypothetical protein [Muribaculaceae bacterium]
MGRIHRYRTALSRRHRSGGFGIHSPFAFNFVLNVLRERLPYYAYDELLRLRNLAAEGVKKRRHPAVISSKNAKMLFRITNYFKPHCTLQVGIDYGIATAATLLPDSRSTCILHAPHPLRFVVAQQVLQPFEQRIATHALLAEALDSFASQIAAIGQQPFVVVNSIDNDNDLLILRKQIFGWFDSCDEAVVIIRNIDTSRRMKLLWNEVKQHLPHGHSYTNEKLAVVVARRNLPLQHFLLWF